MGQMDYSRLLTTVNPVLAAEWHPTRNITLTLNTIYANSGKKAWWQCKTCDYEWEAVIASRNSAGRGCPCCAGKIATSQNSLVSLHPHIAADYDHERNAKPVELITAVSHYKAWWKCSVNSEHSWQAMVMNRVRQGDGCPYCSGRYATAENNLAIARPDLAQEFDLVKNAPLTPYDLTPKTPKKFWWICSENHSYQRSLNDRNGTKNSECWECKSLGFLFPNILNEWDYSKNAGLDPYVISYGSRKQVWWVCSTGHSWRTTPNSRTNQQKNTGCPDCIRSQTSDIEEQLRKTVINSHLISQVVDSQNAVVPALVDSRNRKYKVDILGKFKGRPIVIEWDSWYWHSEASGGGYASYLRDTTKTEGLLAGGCYVVRVRESRPDVSLLPLQLDNPHLLQLSYDYNAEGRNFQKFCETLRTWLQAL